MSYFDNLVLLVKYLVALDILLICIVFYNTYFKKGVNK